MRRPTSVSPHAWCGRGPARGDFPSLGLVAGCCSAGWCSIGSSRLRSRPRAVTWTGESDPMPGTLLSVRMTTPLAQTFDLVARRVHRRPGEVLEKLLEHPSVRDQLNPVAS